MKSALIASVLALLAASSALAAPAENEARNHHIKLTFLGAADAQYSEYVPTDGSVFYITNRLSVSKISSHGGASCNITGAEGSKTVVPGWQTKDVGPPQPQDNGTCHAY